MKTPKNLISPEQIAAFDAYMIEAQNALNLRDWRIEPSGKPASKGAFAEVAISMEDRLAVYSVGRDWGPAQITDKLLKETALHEVLHVFLKPLMQACYMRDEQQAETLEHSAIVVLEKLLSQ